MGCAAEGHWKEVCLKFQFLDSTFPTMASRNRLDLRKSLWICGATNVRQQRHAAYNVRVLKAAGTEIFMFEGGRNADELDALRQRLWKNDNHVILSSWLKPLELAKLYPLLRDRKNFSIVADDWWQMPWWAMRDADYILFRKYHGMAVRLGQKQFFSGVRPPPLLNPFPYQISFFSLLCAALRPLMLAAAPFWEVRNWWRRRHDTFTQDRYIFLPFGIDGNDVPMLPEKIQYDFGNTSGTLGIWFMRDPYAPSTCTFANLYHDRRRLADMIGRLADDPFTYYDCRHEKNYYVPWDVYLQKTQQCRFVVCSGGLQDAALPKFLEHACMGVPMIGRPVPFEHPWQDEVFFSVDMMRVTRRELKRQLHEALERYPVMREKCLNLRERLLKLYDFNAILDMAQAQIAGQPIPADYIRPLRSNTERSAGNAPTEPVHH